MYCTNCGAVVTWGDRYCGSCGMSAMSAQSPVAGGQHGGPPAQPPWDTGSAQAGSSGNGFAIAGIICGAIAFLLFPIILGPAGLILGAIGLSRKESMAPVAMTVAGLGLVVGMILGVIVFSATV